MEEAQKPPPLKRQITLKLPSLANMSSTTTNGASSATTPGAATTPATPSGGPPKIKLVRKSLPSTPLDGPMSTAPTLPTPMAPPPLPTLGDNLAAREATPKAPATGSEIKPKKPRATSTTKAGRVSKPSAKKRAKDDADDSDEEAPLSQSTAMKPQIKRVRLSLTGASASAQLKKKTKINVKTKSGKRDPKTPGDGYDSEADDRELDPAIEDQLFFRMIPGEHCDYLREMINDRKFGLPLSMGGADFQMKFLDDEIRRAMVTIKGQPFAAVLVDLPTITESMKTWDKKNMVKSADVCQMLLVFAPVKSEAEALEAPLPRTVETGYRWPHGITPPMHDCRRQRFRKRLSKLEIADKNAEVDRLRAADKAAISSSISWIDDADESEEDVDAVGEEYDEDEDAEGDAEDYFGDANLEQQTQEQLGDDSQFDLNEDELEAEFEAAPDTPADGMDFGDGAAHGGGADGITPATANSATPGARTESPADAQADGAQGEGDEESGDDDDEEDEDDDDMDGGDMEAEDDENDEQRGNIAAVRSYISTLKKQLAKSEQELIKAQSPILKKRLQSQIRDIKAEIALKKSSIGETDEED